MECWRRYKPRSRSPAYGTAMALGWSRAGSLHPPASLASPAFQSRLERTKNQRTAAESGRLAALPIRRQEAKRVPPFRPPGVSHLAALEDHVVDRAGGQMSAHSQSGLAGAYDDGGREPHDTRSLI